MNRDWNITPLHKVQANFNFIFKKNVKVIKTFILKILKKIPLSFCKTHHLTLILVTLSSEDPTSLLALLVKL